MLQQIRENVLNRFFESPLAKKLLADSEREHFELRKKLAAELAAVNARIERELIPAIEKAKAAEQAAVKARRECRNLERAAGEARVVSESLATQIDRRRADLERQLLELPDPTIVEFCETLRLEISEIRRAGITSATVSTGKYRISGEPVLQALNNQISVNAATEARRVAIEKAEALQLEALEPEELRARLEALRAELPVVGDPVPVE